MKKPRVFRGFFYAYDYQARRFIRQKKDPGFPGSWNRTVQAQIFLLLQYHFAYIYRLVFYFDVVESDIFIRIFRIDDHFIGATFYRQ